MNATNLNNSQNFYALIVDDDPISRKILRINLSAYGFLCDEADDGQEAESYLEAREYDLHVIDLVMPNRTGHSLAIWLVDSERDGFVVVHTAVKEPAIIRAVAQTGVNDIIFKPSDYSMWAAKMRGLLLQRAAVYARQARKLEQEQWQKTHAAG